mgnify:CR=1 FL=1
MLSLFQRKRVPPAAGTPPTSAIETPKGLTRPESAASLLATPRRQKPLEHSRQCTSLSRRQFATLKSAILSGTMISDLRPDETFPADVTIKRVAPGGEPFFCLVIRDLSETVIALDLNPLSRTARTATLTIVDELTRALPNITDACRNLTDAERTELLASLDNNYLLSEAIREMTMRLAHALD